MNNDVTDEMIIKACSEEITMASAAASLNIHFNTFKRRCLLLGCYKPNQPGRGVTRKTASSANQLDDILDGKYPGYSTYKLKNRLLKNGTFENICSVCGLEGEWNGECLRMELDHINGNRTDHRLVNLRMICPNCHAQTPTYRSKNRKRK